MTQLPYIRRTGARESDTLVGYDMVRPHRDDRLSCDVCKLEISSRAKYQSKQACECDRIFGSSDDATAGLASREGGFDLDEHNHPPRESCYVRTVVMCDSCPPEGGQDPICRGPLHYEAVIRDRQLVRLLINGWEVFPHKKCSMDGEESFGELVRSDCLLHHKMLAPGSEVIPPRPSQMDNALQDMVLLHGARVRAWCPSCDQADAALCTCAIKLRVYTVNGVLTQVHLQGHQILPYKGSIFEQQPELVPFPCQKTRYSTIVPCHKFMTKLIEMAAEETGHNLPDVKFCLTDAGTYTETAELTPHWKKNSSV